MSEALEQAERAQPSAIQAPKEISHIPGSAPGISETPKVVIKGDIRLRVTASYAALRPVKAHYQIETEGMQDPLHVIWIIEGNVLNHTVHSIDVEFDMKGMSTGEILTRLLTAQVTDKNGQGCIVHSSVFVQIFVLTDDLSCEMPLLNKSSL